MTDSTEILSFLTETPNILVSQESTKDSMLLLSQTHKTLLLPLHAYPFIFLQKH